MDPLDPDPHGPPREPRLNNSSARLLMALAWAGGRNLYCEAALTLENRELDEYHCQQRSHQ